MSKTGDTEYWHNKGEQDAADGSHHPPHQEGSKNYWESDMGGRPVTDSDKRADYDAYEKGWQNTENQKDSH
jgi:hypothetical protein